jgi:hypothetical protein
MPPLDRDPKFSAAGRGFRSLWTRCELADFLIDKANQIEASGHISFFSEFKKQKSQHSLAIRIARAAGSKTISSSFPPSKNALRPFGLGLTSHGSLLDGGGGFVTTHKYHRAKSCQDLLCDIERIGFNLNASRERLGDSSRSRTHSG